MGKKGGSKEAARARREEEQRQARVRAGTSQINSVFDGQFTDDFFKTRAQSYLDYANPQLEDQYNNATKELSFALARSGTLDSSVRGGKLSELQKLYDIEKQNVADQAQAQSKQLRGEVERSRGDLISTLSATGDAKTASNSAINQAELLSKPAAFSPLENLFADFMSGLGTQVALERAASYEGNPHKPRYSTGLFSPTNAVKVSP
ncbi:hypothetical protein [Polycladidibacter hongkongensis]|uniref:hypothetical protein n=1 Tax=Polycladidibacter hongkongensis TaxID=1647556 RepID=UPI000836D6D4|nr:hypothetical protein [Pseudovibrio hongkongensis]